jgi:hypothetical protein
MNSLTELNAWGNTPAVFEFAQEQALVFALSAVTTPQTLHKPDNVQSFDLPIGVNITSASVVPDNCTLVVDTNDSDISIEWLTVPRFCTVDTVPGNPTAYRITGPFLLDVWEQIRSPRVQFPTTGPVYRDLVDFDVTLTIGATVASYVVEVELDPLISDVQWYVLDASGGYTATEITNGFNSIYWNKFPYLEVVAEGDGTSGSRNSIASLTLTTLNAGSEFSNTILSAAGRNTTPQVLTPPTGGLKSRYLNFYENLDPTFNSFIGGAARGSYRVTATTTSGRTLTQDTVLRRWNNEASVPGLGVTAGDQQPNWTRSGATTTVFRGDTDTRGTVASDRLTFVSEDTSILLNYRQNSTTGFDTTKVVVPNLFFGILSARYSWDFETGTGSIIIDNTPGLSALGIWTDLAFDISIAGTTRYTKTSGSITVTGNSRVDISSDLDDELFLPVQSKDFAMPYVVNFSMDNASSYSLAPGTGVFFTLILGDPEDFGLRANLQGPNPAAPSLGQISASTMEFQTRRGWSY